VLYARKSTDREDKQMLSISAQLEEMRKIAADRGIRIFDERTEHYSAREPGRPVFSKLLSEIERGTVDGLLCWTVDRLARNPVDGGRLTHALGRSLKEIVTHDGVYAGTSDTKFMLQVVFGAATKTIDDLSASVKRGNRKVYAMGRITGRPPLGYMKRADRSHYGASPVVPDPERFELVRGIWRDVLGGCSARGAWRRAQDRGLRGRSSHDGPGTPVGFSTVYTLLRNPFYAGLIVRDGETYPAEHEPMIALEHFERVQRIVSGRCRPRERVHDFAYTGLLRCGYCGSLLIGERARGRSAHYTYYRCHRKVAGRVVCKAPAPREEEVTADIEAFLARVTLPPPIYRWSLDALDWWEVRGHEEAAAMAQDARRRIGIAEARLARLTDALLDGAIDGAEHARRKAELQTEVIGLRRQIEQPTSVLDEWLRGAREMLTFGRECERVFRSTTNGERRRLLSGVMLNHVVTNRRTAPTLRFPYSLLEELPPILRGPNPMGLNRLPEVEKVLECETTASSQGEIERGCSTWSAILRSIRTDGPG
jgi:site-specific DNA recombinase